MNKNRVLNRTARAVMRDEGGLSCQPEIVTAIAGTEFFEYFVNHEGQASDFFAP